MASLAGVFYVESQAPSPASVLDKLYGKIRQELNHWLKNRSFFEDDNDNKDNK